MTNGTGEKLRIGLLMDSFDIPSWAYVMLEKIKDSYYGEIKLIVLNDSVKKRKGLLAKIASNYNRVLYIGYWALENRLHRPKPDAFEIKNSNSLLKDVPVLKVRPRHTKHSDWIEDADIGKIKGYDVDVFIRLGFGILHGKILMSAKYGVWSYHHGDNERYRGGPAGFWEVFENNPVTGSILQILTEDLDNGTVLYRGYSRTDPVSVKYNRNGCHWKTLNFIPRKLEELYRVGEKAFFDRTVKQDKHSGSYRHRIYTVPHNGVMLRLLIRYALRYIRQKISRLFYFSQWCLMFNLSEGLSFPPAGFRRIIPDDKNIFWADPCVVRKDDNYYIFIEEFLCRSGKGRISVISMDREGRYGRPEKILERPYHLSNPFVFESRGSYYMIPETAENRTVELYKCVEFPYRWELEKVLIKNIRAYDPTLFWYGQKWWLYANIAENEGAPCDDELFLFYCGDFLKDDWMSHSGNPIVSDVRRARPAGRVFEYNGQIYRPSQDCSVRYGYGIRLNKVLKLNESEYEETEINRINPYWGNEIQGVHSLAYEKGLTVIDALIRRSRLRHILHRSR